jgi:hypothetical protein
MYSALPTSAIYGPGCVSRWLKRKAAEAAAQPSDHTSTVPPPSITEAHVSKVRAWLLALGPFQRERAYTIDELCKLTGLAGRCGPNAAAPIVRRAMRQLGFSPARDWTERGRNRRYSYLPRDKP